jgi:hypothetical protein
MTPTLPQPPFAIPKAGADETAPRSLPIRGQDADIERNGALGPLARRLYEYGKSVNWQCTLAEAADACGMTAENARSVARFAGFNHRFVGFMLKHSLDRTGRAHGQDNYSSQLSHMRQGHDFDPNLIPVDLLMK